MSNSCPKCGASPDADEYVDEDEKSICQSCGFVLTEAGFINQAVQIEPSGKPKPSYRRQAGQSRFHYGEHPYEAVGHTVGRKTINVLCGVMSCPSSITDESLKLYDRVFMHKYCHFRRLNAKTTMAAVCVYIVCRKYNWLVTLMSMCETAGCQPKSFSKWKRIIIKAFDIDISSIDVLDLAKKRCRDAGICVETCEKAIRIIELCRDLCVSDNRLSEHIISAASYLAWLSDDPIARKRVNFSAFCKEHKFSRTRQSMATVQIISGVMCRLAVELPWVTKQSFRTSNVSLHVNDIIKYQSTLLSDSRATYIASLSPSERENLLLTAENEDSVSPDVGEDSSTEDEEDDSSTCDSHDESVDTRLKMKSTETAWESVSTPASQNGHLKVINFKDFNPANGDCSEVKDHSNSVTIIESTESANIILPSLKHISNHSKNLKRAGSILFSVKHSRTEPCQPKPLNAPCLLDRNLDDVELCEDDISESELRQYIKSDTEMFDDSSLIADLRSV